MENLGVLLEPVRTFLAELGVFAPRLALAVVVLVAGWLLAKLARYAIEKGLRAINFHILTQRAGIDAFLSQGGIESDTTDIFAILVYWLVVLAALVIACNTLGLTYITDLLTQVLRFLPRVLIALVVLAFGIYFARFTGQAITGYCRNVGVSDAELLGRLAQYAIVVFVVLIALDQVDIGSTIIRETFLILLAGVVLALALAFGLGGQKAAAELLERWRSRGERPPGP